MTERLWKQPWAALKFEFEHTHTQTNTFKVLDDINVEHFLKHCFAHLPTNDRWANCIVLLILRAGSTLNLAHYVMLQGNLKEFLKVIRMN